MGIRADLTDADLRGANFTGAKLDGADLSGVKLRTTDLSDTDLRGADLSEADLCGTNLGGANLTGANLYGADLTGATLYGANLTRARLARANLTGTNLTGTNLTGANLSGTNLSAANLRGADLSDADVRFATLSGAIFADSNLAGTKLDDTNLEGLVRARLTHRGRSAVDWTSIVKSITEPRLKDFLRNTGMADVFVEYVVDCGRSLQPGMVFSLLQSTFISYGGPDEPFARKLNDALERCGVTTFFFKDDAPPGERLHRVMRKGINDHDRTILICSEASLQRPGLLNELEETLAREARDGGRTYLIPVRLDDYVLAGWAPANLDLAQTVRDRVIADFREHESEASFNTEVAKLITVLKRPVVHR